MRALPDPFRHFTWQLQESGSVVTFPRKVDSSKLESGCLFGLH